MSTSTLVLTPWMAPHTIVSWQTAILMRFSNKVDVLEEYDELIVSPSLAIKTPAVVRLKRTAFTVRRPVKFSRFNVFTRDRFTCQYCGVKKATRELSYDHVIPRVQGGKTTWENIVAACFECNRKKSGRTPEQAAMRLLRVPVKPRSLPVALRLFQEGEVPTAWCAYWR